MSTIPTAAPPQSGAPGASTVLEQVCKPRQSVFDRSIRDTVYNIDDLDRINGPQFFAENYVTDGMKQLLTEAFKRLEGQSSAPGAFLLSQSMGGGKTHNLLALGLLARHPELRQAVMGGFHTPGDFGAVRVVTFNGRKTHTPFGIWGEIATQLNKRDGFSKFYTPLTPPGSDDWVELLRGAPVLIMLDELPPYFEAARAVTIGATTLDRITTTALANLLVAVTSDKLPGACVVLSDLHGAAYGAGSADVSQALSDLELETSRSVMRIDPVRLNTVELYEILRTRIFESLPPAATRDMVATAYQAALNDARLMDLSTASPAQLRADVLAAYPFHPAIRDLFARFKENPGFQQTRALIRIMRIVVAALWETGEAKTKSLIGVHDLDLHRPDVMSEIRQINASLDVAIAHDIADDNRRSVAEQIDGEDGSAAQDAARLIFLSSLSQAINPTLGLNRSEIVACLAAPGRDLSTLTQALDRLQNEAWYVHPTAAGALLFKNTENLVAKQETYARGLLPEQRLDELREQLTRMFTPKFSACYQDVQCLPALDEVTLTADKVTLVVFRPSPTARDEITRFFEYQPLKNRVLFLTGTSDTYQRVLERSALLRAMKLIVRELRQQNVREDDPQLQDATTQESKEQGLFYQACREAFQVVYYPSRNGLTRQDMDFRYQANNFSGEEQIIAALKQVQKYREDTRADAPGFRTSLENKLWGNQKEVRWSDVRQRAASDSSWFFHHPRALDDVKAEFVRRDQWRESGGFVERGPFPKPPASVQVQQLSRDDQTGEVTLRIKPLYADRVLWNQNGPASQVSESLQAYDIKTRALSLSFLAIDTTGEHQADQPVTWQNAIEVKHRFFHEAGAVFCELQAVPDGEIRFTTDGSQPDQGTVYSAPFAVPDGARFVLARANAAGITSEVMQADVPARRPPGSTGAGPTGPQVPVIDPRKPATWRRQHTLNATGEAYAWLDKAVKHRVQVGGLALAAMRDRQWVELRTDESVFQPAEQVRSQADLLKGIVEGGNLTLEAAVLRFESGQDLEGLVADLRVMLTPGEVVQ